MIVAPEGLIVVRKKPFEAPNLHLVSQQVSDDCFGKAIKVCAWEYHALCFTVGIKIGCHICILT